MLSLVIPNMNRMAQRNDIAKIGLLFLIIFKNKTDIQGLLVEGVYLCRKLVLDNTMMDGKIR